MTARRSERRCPMKFVTAEEAVRAIRSNERVFIQGGAASPQRLINAMVARAAELRNVEIVHLHTEGEAPYTRPEFRKSFSTRSLFIAANIRAAVASGEADYAPVFLSEIPALFRKNILPLDVALVHVSPPDRHGYCSLGVSVDIARAAVDCARIVIAQINPKMPRTLGDGLVHVDQINAMIEIDAPLHEVKPPQLTEVDRSIGKHIAELIEDGATLQMGIGSIPNAVLASLTNHKNLGIHTEMFSDGLIDLAEKGVVNGRMK